MQLSPHMKALDAKYPNLGMSSPGCISAEVGLGWVKLLEPCLLVLDTYNCEVDQIKAKFCELRIYWHGDVLPVMKASIEATIAAAVVLSLETCEVCGSYAEEGKGEIMSGRRRCNSCLRK